LYQSLAREDTNHTLSKKAKNESHRDGFLIQATGRLDWFGSPAARYKTLGDPAVVVLRNFEII
jgi:hypothetical protein